MAIGRKWAGKVYGTNIGNVFVTLEGDDPALTGVVRLNELGIGIAVYSVEGTFAAGILTMIGHPQIAPEGVQFGQLALKGTLNARGEIHGDWETTIGSAGTFILFPHFGHESVLPSAQAEQFHTARHNFGAVELDREQVTRIAEDIRQDFPKVVITVVAETEQARYLEDFKEVEFAHSPVEVIKIFASRADGAGENQAVSLEFGPQVNSAMTQGANEAWVLGKLETLKRGVKPYERSYITSFKRWGIGINQLLILGTIVFLPSLASLRDRAILMAAVLGLIVGANWLHSKYVPYAAIYLNKRKPGFIARKWPSFASWAIGIVTTALAAALAIYLQGLLPSNPAAKSDQATETTAVKPVTSPPPGAR